MVKNFVSKLLLVFTTLAFFCLILLVEWPILKTILIIFGVLTIGFLLSSLTFKKSELSYEMKPMRRLVMIILTFDLFAFLSLTFGLSQFFPTAPFVLISLPVVLLIGWVSIRIWQMYFNAPAKDFLPWAIMLALSLWEIVWVINLLPLGYFVSSVLSTWVWYVVHLFIRFHLGPQKIIWRKQFWFLITNIILFLLILLFFVRWI